MIKFLETSGQTVEESPREAPVFHSEHVLFPSHNSLIFPRTECLHDPTSGTGHPDSKLLIMAMLTLISCPVGQLRVNFVNVAGEMQNCP